ncbi:MAG: DNA polymerase III subunit delta [Alphaproteobacteria bacterium]|nr:DNA polymerase III subunit delta [Alphaproteobacteria bacterium]
MKAKAYQVLALKKEIQSSYRGALVYGPDFGSVQETAEQIAKMITPDLKDDFCVVRLTPSKIKENKSCVLDNANAMSLMGGRRLIWIKEADNTCSFIVEEVLNQVQTDAFILITADNLQKNSLLRVASENHSKFLTIACYADDEKDIVNTISTFLQEAGYRSSPSAMNLLKERLTENRLTTRRELEKLITYMGERKNIEDVDVYQIITCSETTSFDTLCMAVANGCPRDADEAFALLLASGETPVGVVRVLIGYFNKLLLATNAIEHREPIDIAVKRVLRVGQFKLENDVKRQLMIWKKEWIVRVLNLLSETEKQTKTTGYPADLMVSRTILMIANVAAKGAKMR